MLPGDVIGIISKYAPVWRLRHKPECDVMLKVDSVIYSFRLLPEGMVATITRATNTVTIWDVSSGERIQTLTGHSGIILCFVVLSASRLVTGYNRGMVEIWNYVSGASLLIMEGPSAVLCMDVFPNGNIITGSTDGTAKIWDPHTRKCVLTLEGHTELISCLQVTQDGDLAITGGWDETVKIWDTKTGECKSTLEVCTPISCLGVLPDDRILVGLSDTDVIHIWDVCAGKCLQIVNEGGGGGGINCLGVLPSGNFISDSMEGKIQIWDGESDILMRVEQHNFPFGEFVVCRNGSVLALSSCQKIIKVLNFF
jgi:WD40 repeat protein